MAEALKESEERFNLAMTASQDGLFDWDYLTNKIYYSPGWKKMLGYKEAELPNDFSVWERLTHPDDLKKSWEVLNEHLQGKRDRFETEFRMKHKDGHWVDILSRAGALFDNNGNAYRVIGTHVDISERKKLERQLRMINDVIENSLNAFNIIDQNGKFIYANKAYVLMWGYECVDDIIGTPLKDHFQDSKVSSEIISQLKENGNCILEYKAKRQDGTFFDALSYARLDYNYQGREIYPTTTIDITDRKEAEEALKDSERKFKAIFNNVHDAVGLHKFHNGTFSNLIDVNNRATEITGFTKEELTAMSVFDLFTKDTVDKIPELMKEFYSKGRVSFQTKQIHKNGGTIDVLVNASSFELGGEGFILVSVRDISEQLKYQHEVAESERKFRRVLESIKLIGLMLDTEANISFCNDYLCTLSGWTKEEILGKNWFDYFIPQNLEVEIEEIFKKTIAAGQMPVYHENEILLKDGSTKLISWNNILSQNDDGEIIGVTSIGEDITERRRNEIELIKSEEKFQKIFYNSPNIMLLMDFKSMTILDANETFLKKMGYKKEEVVNIKGKFANSLNRTEKSLIANRLNKENRLSGLEINITTNYESMIIGYIFAEPIEIAGVEYHSITVVDVTEHRMAEKKLVRSEALLREAQQIAKVGSWDWDVKTGKTHWSTEVYNIYEMDSSLKPELKYLSENVVEDDKPLWAETLGKDLYPNKFDSIDYRIITKSGKLKYITSTAKPIYKDDQLIKIVGTIQDNTIIKTREAINLSRLHLLDYADSHTLDELLEETLNEAEKLTRSKIGFYHFVEDDQNTVFLQNWSTQTKQRFCKAEAKGMHYNIDKAGVWVDCIYQRRPVIHNDYKSLSNKKGMPEGHAEVTRELVVPVIRGNKITAILGVGNKESKYAQEDIDAITILADMAFEIVEKKKAEDELKQQEENIRAIFNSAPVAMMILNEEYKVVSVNEVLKTSFNIKDQDILFYQPGDGLNCIVLKNNPLGCGNVDECKNCAMRNTTKEVIETNQPIHNREINGSFIINGEETNIWISLSIVPLLLQNKKHVIVAYTDITERKIAEKALVESQRLSAIGEMSSAIAHDFNNSLQSIFGNLELAMVQKELPEKLKTYLNTIKTSAQDAAVRVDLLQRFSGQKQTGSLHNPVDINTMVEEVIIQSRPVWKDKVEREGFKVEIKKRLTEVQNVLGNAPELRSVIYNVVKNAIEAMPKGGELTFETVQEEDEVCLLISDTGIGMSEETLTRVFQPFFSTKGFELGRGLGMSGAYSIIREHGGTMRVKETQINQGTKFEICLPVTNQKISEQSEKEYKPGKGAKVLFVDDDKLLRETILEMLDCLGHEGEAVKSGMEALEKLKSIKYDLVITDIGMPGMNGWELASKIRELYSGRIKVAVVTGWGAQLEEKKKNEYGVGYVLGKPFKMEELGKLIREVIEI